MSFGNFSAEEVKDLRERTGWGMMECKDYLERGAILHAVREATTFEELQKIVERLVERVFPDRRLR